MTISAKDHEERFIRRIRKALGRSGADSLSREAAVFSRHKSPEQERRLETIRARTTPERRELLDRLIAEGKPLNARVTPLKDAAAVSAAIDGLVAETRPEWGDHKSVVQWDHPLIASLNLEAVLADQGVPVYTAAFQGGDEHRRQRQRIREQVTAAYIGVTSADFCLADTATLVMKTRPGEARSVSLVPSIHVAVIRLEQLLADLKELYTLLKWDPSQQAEGLTHHMAFISGPSKTADIELTMVHGAHGPRELHLYVITG